MYFVFSMLMLSSFFAKGQTFEWVRTFGSTGVDSGNASVVDASGNVYTTGTYRGTFDADPGAGVTTLTANAGGGVDFYITKFDASGNFIWAKTIGGSDFDQAYSMAVDGSGNIYLTGYFAYIVDFNPGPGVNNLGFSGGYTQQGFLLKLDTNGNYVWAKQFNSTASGSNMVVCSTVTLDTSGNVLVGAYFKGPASIDSEPVVFSSLSGSVDFFYLKYSSAGVFQWAKQIGSSASESITSIAADATGNIYLTGNFNGLTDFDPSAVTQNLGTTGGYDAFLMKADASGNYVWATKIGGLGDDYGRNVGVSPTGSVYVAGNFNGTVNFANAMPANNIASNGSTDNFISKYDSNANYLWTSAFGGTGGEFISSLAFDVAGNIFSTGSFGGTVDFDPSTSTYNLVANGSDAFILKLNSSGNLVNASRFGGSGNEVGNFIKVDASGKIITTGNFSGNCYFNPNSNSTDNVVSAGTDDGFVHKMLDPSLGLQDVTFYAFQLYPNPSNGVFTLYSEVETSYTIVNELGQILQNGKIDIGNNILAIQDQPNGLYFLQCNNGKALKIVKQ